MKISDGGALKCKVQDCLCLSPRSKANKHAAKKTGVIGDHHNTALQNTIQHAANRTGERDGESATQYNRCKQEAVECTTKTHAARRKGVESTKEQTLQTGWVDRNTLQAGHRDATGQSAPSNKGRQDTDTSKHAANRLLAEEHQAKHERMASSGDRTQCSSVALYTAGLCCRRCMCVFWFEGEAFYRFYGQSFDGTRLT